MHVDFLIQCFEDIHDKTKKAVLSPNILNICQSNCPIKLLKSNFI